MGMSFVNVIPAKPPMNKMIVQIYEVQTPSEAEILMALGVDHIGSVILSQESWKIPSIRDTVHLIQEKTTGRSSLIPLFDDYDTICFMLDYYEPNIIHFCEAISLQNGLDAFCNKLVSLQKDIKKRFPEIKIMRSIPIPQCDMSKQGEILELARMFEAVSDYFLTDTLIVNPSGSISDFQPVKGFVGITGKTCNWDMAAKLVQSTHTPVILAGGITPDNVFDGIMQVLPAGVDSCTGTNASDSEGRTIRFKKDIGKVKNMVEEICRAERILGKDGHRKIK
jgi:phosphoribosylanthranilate isomerase